MKNRALMIHFSKTGNFDEIDYYLKMVIRQAVIKTLEYENFQFDAEVSVTLCDNRYIHRLNKKYRKIDRPTDVLSFPMYADGIFDGEEGYGAVMLGDVVISLERAKEQAKEIGNSFLYEIAFLAIHSTLHLLGYDHERSAEEDELQCKKQRDIVSMLEI